MDYFTSMGHPCPLYTNPTDFYLSLGKGEGAKLADAWSGPWLGGGGSLAKGMSGSSPMCPFPFDLLVLWQGNTNCRILTSEAV